ncbi:dTDP-glucose 4,6-dehydratase [Streptomyces albospinus]|uniref:dTDP-glucose 4,6-dehydratase n=1 Tax=Streptomyces albospinus TaxID=285515 RepID=A0ABQ2V9N8_9ACTN|nr:dTDP-glucose 4,6-dehydratase [Streptomyces albospinus]GGU74204.1 dTDP-glucose 4,6-dehydratase [Streptomyces albospinus]
MRLLVTGAAGFIGSHYVRGLLSGAHPSARDVHVTVLDKLTYAGNPANLAPVRDHPGFTFVHGDICDAALLTDLLPGHDAVVNFAAETHVDRSLSGPDDFVRTNVLGTHTLLEAARRAAVPRLVHVSTDEVYGSIDEGSWTEDSPLRPNSPYAATKAGADLLVRSYARTHGLDVSITRCSNNYGPYQYPEKVIPLFVTTLLSGGTVPLYGDGRNVRDWLHVDDHCRGIHLVLEQGRPGEVYHIGSGEELTNLHLTELLLDACGADPDRVRHVPDRPGHDRRYSLDDRKLRALGYAPQVPFGTGLLDTVTWYRDNPGWWQPLRSRDTGPTKD